jgi:hypothetical protein
MDSGDNKRPVIGWRAGSRTENHNIPVKLIGFLYWNFVMIEFLLGAT